MDIATKYQKLTPIEHILKRPGMYIGGIEEIENDMWILVGNKIIKKLIVFSPGLYKIFDEIIVNTYDQTIRDETLSTIKVNINEKINEITVFNDGVGIDVVIHPIEKIYVPELIFSHLLTSTSFDESKVSITGGIHGLGVKLTSIFSKYFKVEVGDPINKRSFSQIYKNNLSIKSKPIISNYNKSTGYVKITFRPDLNYFKLKNINVDLLGLMYRRVYDLAALARKNVKVYLNDKIVPINDFEQYVTFYTNNPFVKDDCDQNSINYGRWKIVISKSEGKFNQISFVNGIYTYHGGRHVDYIMSKIIKAIQIQIKQKYKATDIKDQFIKDQLWIFLASSIENPTFSSQTKDELMTPANKFGSTCDLSKGFIKKIFDKLKINEIVEEYIRLLENSILTKLTVGKKKNVIKDIHKLYDANYAGTKRSNECTIILTEGDSAKTMAISGLSAIPNGNNYYGVFPLKGKLLNVREASNKQIVNNEEFKNIQKILGLKINKHYSQENLLELRYSNILLMMDADVDGSHIKGLLINMIDYFWPSLLKIDGFIKIFITPIVKVTNKKNVLSFYTLTDYENWKNSIKLDKWEIKYYKGLGTNTSAEAKEYFKNLNTNIIKLIWDKNSDEFIKLAFEKEQADSRKVWLKEFDKNMVVDFTNKLLTYSDFINKELIHFSNYDNIRSIPSIVDGLKPSQRKVLYASFKKNLITDIKVAQFVGYVSEITYYHHGEVSLANTIIGMAQNFVGNNNINLLVPSGQFGTRLLGGKDHASPRYIYTQLRKITRLIFHKDDDDLLNYLEDDGFPIEPEYYVPIIPMILVNGTEGIGTGYSTYIPKFNPIDIINNIKSKLDGGIFKEMKPWYNNFRGNILKIDKNLYYTKGIYRINKERQGKQLIITELPIGYWTENYKTFLESSMLDGKLDFIKNIKNNSTESTIEFTIKFKNDSLIEKMEKEKDKDESINLIEKQFGLTNKINMGNMYLHDKNDKMKRYSSVIDILDEFFELRLEFYEKRKQHLLKKLQDELLILNARIQFIKLVINKKVTLLNIPKANVIKILEKNKIYKLPEESPYDYLIKMPFYFFTKEKIDELNKIIIDKNKLFNTLKNKKIKDLWIEDLNELMLMLIIEK